jgi:cell wall-associated NlpC family hydrolase
MTFPVDLRAGDILLYSGGSLTDALIELKEGEPNFGAAAADSAAHVEIYMGNGVSYASRNGIGVNAYSFRADGLHQVRRPQGYFNEASVRAWMSKGIAGGPYGWGDILLAVDIPSDLPGVDCSHFAESALTVGGLPQFDPEYPANRITPRDFKLSPCSRAIWDNGVKS